MSTIKSLLDQRYGLRTPRLHATVTAAPLVAGRSAGYVIATVGGVGGVRVNVSPDMRAPYAVGDTLVVDGVGTPAATEYWASGRIAGARADSDIYQYPEGGTVTISGTPTTLGAGDIVLGSTLTDMSNWWYQYELGRWQIRKGTLMHGAIGDLNSLYGYATSIYGTAFGQYSAGQVNITTDSTNGFRIRNYETPVFQADTTGVVWALSTFRAGTGDDMVGMSATDATWRLYAGSATPASAPFRVDKDGALTATGATISGAITSGTIDIGGADATSFHVDVDGNVWSGAAAYVDGVFKVSSTGALTATGATITAGAGAVILDADGVTLASAVSGGAGSLKTKSSTKLIGEYYTGRDGGNDVSGGVDLLNYDATSNVTSSFGVYHSAGLSSRYVSASTPTTSVNTIVGSKLVLNIRAATGTVVSLQDNFTTEYWGLTNAGTMIGPAWKPAANSTTALQMQKANGDAVVTIDTTNSELEVTGGVIVSGGISQKGIYNVLNYGSVGNGSTDDTAAITAAHAAATATGGEIHFPSGTYLITATTFAADTSLRFAAGAMLSIPTGETITINGAISAGDQQIFTGVGSVRINNATGLNAMWFGVSAANAAATNDAGFARLLRSFPAANATTFDAYNVPSTATGQVVKLPAGIITISATVNMTNIGTLILQGADAAGNYGNTFLAWDGAAAGTMVLMDGTPGSALSYIGLLGRGIAGVGLLLDRSNVNYVRSYNTFNNLSIADCSVAGLLISSADAPNLYQVDNIQFYNVLIQRCYGGVCINNRNTLNVHFFALRVAHNGAAGGVGGIVPTYALWVKYGGCIIHSFDFGGPSGDDFADYPIQVENGFVQIFGGYTENGQLISGNSENPSGATDNTGITTTGSYIITNVTDTSDFNVLDRVIVDKGVAGAPGPCEIVSKTADSLTVNAIGTSDETGVTVKTSHVTDNTIISSNIIGFNHYPSTDPSAPAYCVYWNQGERSLNISGSRIGQHICEGAHSGGINFVDSQLHNVPDWTGRTKYSSVRNTRVLRSYSGTGTDYIVNWDGLTGSYAADTVRDIALSNNFYRRDNYLVSHTAGTGSILRLIDGKLQLYALTATTAEQTFDVLDYDPTVLNFALEAGWSTAKSGHIILSGKTLTFGYEVPTAGTWVKGSTILNSAVYAGGSMGWMCVTSGTFSSATDSTGVTAIGSYTITGVTDTSDFAVGDWVEVDKGITGHPGPFEILAKTASTITVNSPGDSVETNVTIATSDPVFKTMPTVAA